MALCCSGKLGLQKMQLNPAGSLHILRIRIPEPDGESNQIAGTTAVKNMHTLAWIDTRRYV